MQYCVVILHVIVKSLCLLLCYDNIQAYKDMSQTINPGGKSRDAVITAYYVGLGRLFHILTVISWRANPDL